MSCSSLYTKTEAISHRTYFGYIFFSTPSGNVTAQWLIDTPYYINYDTRIADQLAQVPGVKILDKYNFPSGNWVMMSATQNNLITVGTVYVHCDPSVCPSIGLDDTTLAVRQVLISNYPSTEIGLAVGIPFAVLLLAMIGLFIVGKNVNVRYQRY